MATLTLQEAADLLDAHYMTVYRYVRLGRLPARKVGGTWEVEEADVEALLSGAEPQVPKRRPADWAKRLEVRLIEGDEAGAWGVVEAALTSGAAPSEIYTELVAPALVSIGSKWHSNDLSVATEHLATAIATRIIGRMGPRFARRGRPKGVVVVTTPPGERHAIPSLMVADLLRGAGFAVVDLGGDVPVDALAEIVRGIDELTAVCISSTRFDADRMIRRSVKAIRGVVPGVPILAGGASVRDADHATALGADGWASDGPGAVNLVMSIVA